jgi:alkylation response protein AidB-like acyl-CoA dehydrogenase
MRFSPTAEQTQLGDTASKLLAGRDLAKPGLDRELVGTLGELDLLGLAVPEALGGAGAGIVELAVLAEQMGGALAPLPFAAGTVACTLLLAAQDDPPAILREILAGSAVPTAAWTTFPQDLVAARRDGLFAVPFGAEADVMVAFGREPFLVDLRQSVRTPTESLDLSEPTATIALDRAEPIPLRTTPSSFAAIRTAWAAELVGTAQRAVDDAVAYAKQRTQFGRAIGSFQAIKHLLADRFVQVSASRSLVHYAAWAVDESAADAELASRTALAAALDAATAATADNLQTHGGIGFTWEATAHRYLRRARARRSLLGSPARQLDGIADRILSVSSSN